MNDFTPLHFHPKFEKKKKTKPMTILKSNAIHLLHDANISALLAGGEERLDGGAEAHNVELCASRETFQCDHHGFLERKTRQA